jgi:hypothetical protein
VAGPFPGVVGHAVQAGELRIAGMGVTPYTDITSLATKPPYFRNTLPSVQYVRGSTDFDYDGVGPVTVTLSKSFDFVSNTCGDIAYGHAYVDISTPGVHTFSIHALGRAATRCAHESRLRCRMTYGCAAEQRASKEHR